MVALARACQRRLQTLHAASLAQRQQHPATAQTGLGLSRTDASTQGGSAVDLCDAGTQTSEPAPEWGGPEPGNACREDGLSSLEPCLAAVNREGNMVRCRRGRAFHAASRLQFLTADPNGKHAGVQRYLEPRAAH